MDPQKRMKQINDLLAEIKGAIMAVEQQIEAAQRIQYDPAGLYAGTMEPATAPALPLHLPSPATPAEEEK